MVEVPVLIVGGGPVGLSASFLLAQQGVRSLLVERHPGTAIHPKARGINVRTMEIYHQAGVEAAVRAAGLPAERTGFVIWARSLAGEEIERRVPGRTSPASQRISPVGHCLCAQDDLEPVLRASAERQPESELRFNAELTGVEQAEGGVTATVLDRAAGIESQVRARYVIAADGAHSRIRQALGIPMLGRAAVYESVNVVLRADLRPWTAHRPAALYFIEHPSLKATFLTINGVDRWGFLVNSLGAYGLTPAEFTPARTAELVRLAAGVPDLPVEILGIVPWTAAAQVAARYRAGNIFLAGDAAHEMPPTGGFGMNTGVQDVHNLAWKLAGVLKGWADPALLDTYEAERRPVGEAVTEQALANTVSMGRLDRRPQGVLARREFLNEQGLIFGAAYTGPAVVPDGTAPPPVANPVTDYVPSARPGSRAPHVWLERSGRPVSTIDLVGRACVLFAGSAGGPWRPAAAATAAARGLPLECHLIGGRGDLADPEGRWPEVYGVEPDGAVLVRPDGHVGWRSPTLPADPTAALQAALDHIVGRSPLPVRS